MTTTSSHGPGAASKLRRYDPDRRDRIIDSCLDVIAAVGVAGVSHRKVAEAADVPLGSMTYHFTGLDQLLHEAFTRFAEHAADQFADQMSTATDPASAVHAVADVIMHHPIQAPRTLVLTQELYTLAARDPRYRDITHTWMRRSRQVLRTWFDPTTARLIDALIEGLTLHRALDVDGRPFDSGDPDDAGSVLTAITRITTTSSALARQPTPNSTDGDQS
jgi:TetR/AcrR family transcriptional regulator, regulator of biofilm formation and stress response